MKDSTERAIAWGLILGAAIVVGLVWLAVLLP
jgi:hypothetical protein